MRTFQKFTCHLTFLVLVFLLNTFCGYAQLKDFVIFGKEGVQLGTSTVIQNGKVGSYGLIKSTGNASFGGDIISFGTVQFANNNTVNGKIWAANATTPPSTGTIFSTGSNARLTGEINVNGNIVIGGGTVNGPVYTTGTYSGPVPAISPIRNNPGFPTPPTLPIFYSLDPVNNGSTITGSGRINPGYYNSLALTGGRTDTFSLPGVYVFNSIKNSGNVNNLVFDFNHDPTAKFKFYIINDVNLYKVNISFINLTLPGGVTPTPADVASRIYMQVGGTGSTSATGVDAWSITNGASGNNQSSWLGTVWAPNGNINVGSGSTPPKVVGNLWSDKQVIIQSGASIMYAAFNDCIPSASAGADQNIDCDHPLATLTGSSSNSTAQFSWSKVGDVIPGNTNTASIQVSKAGTYVLTVTSMDCISPATDTVIVTSSPCILPYYPPPVTGKVTSKIGSELTSLKDNYGNVTDDGRTLFIIQNDKVLIDIIVYSGKYSTVKSTLLSPAYGLTDTITNGPGSLIITGLYPIAHLDLLNQDPIAGLINFVRPSYPPVTNSGLIQTQGDMSMRSDLARNGFNIAGDGIKIGVLSDSYNTLNKASQDMDNRDLPGPNDTVNTTPVSVLLDYPFGARSDEGRAMLQILHDVAPKAKLAFRTGFLTPGDMAQGIRQLADSNCNVIVDDVTFITEPFFGPGVIANAIKDVSALGVHYVTAAGNFGDKSYGAVFNPATAPLPAGIYGQPHDFGGGTIYQIDSVKGSVAQPGIYTVVLQWQDDFYSLGGGAGTNTDLDAYAVDNLGNVIGFNRINTNGDPTEALTFIATQNTVVKILIVKAAGTSSTVRFKYVVFRGDLKITNYQQDASTIVGQGNAPEAITVGAALYSNTPAFGVQDITKASFSSVGGTIYNGSSSQKPDIVGPNGVNTSVSFGSIDLEGDGTPNFFGTSAAAPHVAGALALMMEARKKFYGQVLTPIQAKQLIAATAINMDAPGFDYNTGNGFIQVDSAIRSMANPTPRIDSILLSDTTVPAGSHPMTLTVYGDYLTSSTKILLNDDTLQSQIIDAHKVTAELPSFSGDKSLYAYNSPKSLLGNDGGLSNAYSITGFAREMVTVSADNKTRKYGERNPALTATVLVNGQPTDLTLQDLGLTGLTLSTLATPASDVGQYFIRPAKTFDSTGVDAPYLALYDYTFTDGILTVQKMPLTITPADKTIIYGNSPGIISNNYLFPTANIDNVAAFTDSINKYYKTFTPDNVLAVVNGFASPLANGSTLTTSDINGLNLMTSFNAVRNSRKFQVINNQLIPASASDSSFNAYYLMDVAAQSIYNYRQNPAQSPFVTGLSGYSAKALFSENALTNGVAKAQVNSQLVPLVNGSLVNMINGLMGAMAPVLNARLVQIVNGQLVQLVNGQLVPLVNTQLVQLVNGQLVQLVNGEFVPIANNQLVQLVNGQLVQLVNNQLVQLVNNQLVPIVNAQLVPIVNGYAQIINGQLVPIVNTQLVPLVNGQLVQLVNSQLVPLVNSQLSQLVNSQLVQVVNGQLVQLVNSATLGGTNDQTAVITDESDASTQNGWLGAMFGINMITGLDVGTQKLIPGVFVNNNFDVTYGLGTATIQPNPCLLTHNIFNNFGSTPKPNTDASMWLNVEVKVSGQLASPGDYLIFTGGIVSFNNVSSTPVVADLPVPTGKIIADPLTSSPVTYFDTSGKMWITKVPVGFSSTSDIFITGAIINSSTGFVTKKGASSLLKGIFLSNRNYSDQWSYAMAGYRPVFDYQNISNAGNVASMNGNYKAGTPIPIIKNLVGGGSSGGGNNYTGSSSSYDNFTVCNSGSSATQASSGRSIVSVGEVAETEVKPSVSIYPNPTSGEIEIALVPEYTGHTSMLIMNSGGKIIYQTGLGMLEKGKAYRKKLDLTRFGPDIYFIKIQNGSSVTVKKLLLIR
ncbi:MAG TPA: S8 family serine peptidase [Chitinophagaceae bacterium]|nr:S8 family serine peptidase [Chitinophagaceae bacterium]